VFYLEDKKKAWLYGRISHDEDKELNSLKTQRQILIDYAQNHNYVIVGESFDDNISGMHFNRQGIFELQKAVDSHSINTVLVKDLSRLGRHKTQTAIFIDYLRTNNVNVYSVSENINTLDENDDLIIGFKGLINDSYAKDISRKIRAGYKQKQKQGIVIIPPFGYIKNKNKKTIEIIPECAEIVKLIFKLYTTGLGYKKIANYLNQHNFKSPSYYQLQNYNKHNSKTSTTLANKWLWQDRTVSEILHNEAYIGTLICGKNYKNTIYHIRKRTDIKEQIRHENYYPKIIDTQTWNTVQLIIQNRVKNHARASCNTKIHKYAGLLQCKQCGATFVAKNRNGDVEYVCNTYHRRGKQYCSSHRVKETELDNAVLRCFDFLLQDSKDYINNINKKLKQVLSNQKTMKSTIEDYLSHIQELETENKNAIKQILKYPEREQCINEIIEENNKNIKSYQEKIEELQNQKDFYKNEKKQSNDIIDILEQIKINKKLSYKVVQRLVKKIYISEENKKNTLNVTLNVSYYN
jgi:DNA invertase Pin-like site-specific DNA recombinase